MVSVSLEAITQHTVRLMGGHGVCLEQGGETQARASVPPKGSRHFRAGSGNRWKVYIGSDQTLLTFSGYVN